MDRMIYLAMSTAQQLMLRQASNNHNLANVNTPGFRADLDALMQKPVYGPGEASRVYVQSERAGIDLDPGTIMQTGRPLDVAINSKGFIAVQAPDGSEAYTRAGDLRITPTGILQTGAGHPVLGEGGPIAVPPFEQIEIGADGTISIIPTGQGNTALTAVDRIKLVLPDPTQLKKTPEGLLQLGDGQVAPADASVQLAGGALETSNVNSVEALVTMIELARQFETNTKLIGIARENDAASTRLLEIS
ncbi:MAG: flagellar basal-body rod protein FlgF [Gammaproteobacteria bacterium]|nr:flagellar basal-body rod protein FlgF [Gammaproteobacteria bacterium]